MPLLIAELNSRLENARELYYAGIPSMSDAEYDSLEAQLKGMLIPVYLVSRPYLPRLAPTLLAGLRTKPPCFPSRTAIPSKNSAHLLILWAGQS
jgi:hypothetical protein